MKQKSPTFDRIFEIKEIMAILNLQEKDIDDRFPIQEVSTGLPFIIIPLKTLNAMKRAKVKKDEYFEFIKDTRAKTLFLFCPQTYRQVNDLNVRMFADFYGIPEDPATGSGNGCLAGYLVKHRYFEKKYINIRVEQGYEIGRPSLLFLRAEEKEGVIDVSVGGSVLMIAKGEFL